MGSKFFSFFGIVKNDRTRWWLKKERVTQKKLAGGRWLQKKEGDSKKVPEK